MIGFFTKLLVAGAIGMTGASSFAQSYPSRTVRLVVPVEPGSPTDTIARLMAQKLSALWGQQLVVENRASVNGLIGTDLVAKSPPDGYTLLAGNSGTHVINVGLYKKLNYDPIKDFVPIAQFVTSPLVLMGSMHFPARDVKEVIAQAKGKSINFAVPGATGQLAGLMFNAMAGVDIVSIPYKGSSGAETALLAGDAQLFFAAVSNALPYKASGRLRSLAVTSLKRAPSMPDVPTLDESGVQGFELDYWIGLFAPAGTPKAIVDKLNADVAKALGSADVAERIQQLGYSTVSETRAEFEQYVKTSVDKYGKLSRDLGVIAQ